MGDINPFDGLATRYQANRPDYPGSMLIELKNRAPEAPRLAIDVGSGTGISTRALKRVLGVDWLVTGIEPGTDMRRQAHESTRPKDGITYVKGTAEALPFEDGSLGVVNVGQAIQFFDRPVFYAAVSRLLTTGGLLSVIQNNRVWQRSELLDAHETYVETNDPTYSRSYRDIALLEEFEEFAWAEKAERLEQLWERVIDADKFVGTMMSRQTMKPTVAKLGKTTVEKSLQALATVHGNSDGTVTIPYVTELFVAQKR